jgi:anti-sigma B factor antagonist
MLANVARIEPDITVAALTGRLHIGSSLMFLEGDLTKLIEGGARKLILDLEGVEYCDSAAIGVIVGTAKVMREAGGDLRLIRLQQRVREILHLSRVDTILQIHADLDSALQAMGAGSGG